ncbi:hypothetical protein AtubIFM54640_010752 [Aspergillus tubingensis]|nr:hypothetical protein AtubIFM54640_010752 [Aspergillus tubingensis]
MIREEYPALSNEKPNPGVTFATLTTLPTELVLTGTERQLTRVHPRVVMPSGHWMQTSTRLEALELRSNKIWSLVEINQKSVSDIATGMRELTITMQETSKNVQKNVANLALRIEAVSQRSEDMMDQLSQPTEQRSQAEKQIPAPELERITKAILTGVREQIESAKRDVRAGSVDSAVAVA